MPRDRGNLEGVHPNTERGGIYRRRIRIVSSPGSTRADLEDDPHRYGVVVRHDGSAVTGIEGIPLRTPWTLCSASAALLDRLIGMPLSPDPLAVYARTNGREQCTHMFDMAGFAVAHAARATAYRQYDVEVPATPRGSARDVLLRRDGREVLRWRVNGNLIEAPAPYAGLELQRLPLWAKRHFPDGDDFEAIVVLRRAIYIAGARYLDLDDMADASTLAHFIMGACYVFQPGVAERAQRMVGSTRDFTTTPEALLADLEIEA